MSQEDRLKWDARYSRGQYTPGQVPGWLSEVGDEIPAEGRALDIAAGAGRISLWMARRGLDVTAVDISPVGLALAREAAADEGVRIATHTVDLSRKPLPAGPFDLIACFHYRQRDLFPAIKERLTPGGVLLAELTTVQNLTRNDQPSKRWLAETNELLTDVTGLSVFYYREGWAGGRHLARVAARRG